MYSGPVCMTWFKCADGKVWNAAKAKDALVSANPASGMSVWCAPKTKPCGQDCDGCGACASGDEPQSGWFHHREWEPAERSHDTTSGFDETKKYFDPPKKDLSLIHI